MTSHFGMKSALTGMFRFNVVHLDGHVDGSLWKEPLGASTWQMPQDYEKRPYGWALTSSAGKKTGPAETPKFEGAFDQNATEFRTVDRMR